MVPNVNHVSFNPTRSGLAIFFFSERLMMHSYQEKDLESSIALFKSNSANICYGQGAPRSRKEVIELVNSRGIERFRNHEVLGLFSIFTLVKRQFIGHFDLLPGMEPGELKMKCVFKTIFYGKTYGLETANAIMNAYVKTLMEKQVLVNNEPITSLSATADPNEIVSWKILEKIGMRWEGPRLGNHLRKYYKIQLPNHFSSKNVAISSKPLAPTGDPHDSLLEVLMSLPSPPQYQHPLVMDFEKDKQSSFQYLPK